jgi:hypothetical protein
MKKELERLSIREAEILNKLRTEYINLNHYKYFRFNNEYENGNCIYCNVRETVSHYLIDCSGELNEMALKFNPLAVNYNKERLKLQKQLQKLIIFFRYPENFTSENLLFPHIWIPQPQRKQKNWMELYEKNMNIKINIFKLIATYVRNTKRFERDKFGI